jgi:predicted nucleotidyltransferase
MEVHLPEDFREFLRLLGENEVEYLLIGGYAVGFYGYPRATSDIDIWVGRSRENAERVVRTLNAFGFAAGVTPELFEAEDALVRMGVPPLRLEILTTISGVNFEEAYARRGVHEIAGVPIQIISLEDLKANKAASGRKKDQADLDYLE